MQRRTRAALASTAALLWAAFIWGLGSDDFSMNSTSRFLGPLLNWLAPNLEASSRDFALVAVRKLAHVGEYAVFALLAGRAIWLAFRPRVRVACAGALALAATLAIADETRQGYSAMRTGSPYDVALDVLGGAIAIGLLYLLKRVRGRPLFEPVETADAPETSATDG